MLFRSVQSVLEQYVAEKKLTPDDLLRTFVSRRVCPLQTRVHKICHMSGPLDPTRVSRSVLTKEQVKQRVKAIARSGMVDTWEWGVEPFERDRLPPNVSNFPFYLSEVPCSGVFLLRDTATLARSVIHCLAFCRDSCARKLRMGRTPPSTGPRIFLPQMPALQTPTMMTTDRKSVV